MATHSSILAWKIPWTEDPGGLQSMGLQRFRYDWTCMHVRARALAHTHTHTHTHTQALPSTELLSEFPRYDHIWTAKSCLLNSKAKLSLKLFLGAASLKVTQPRPSNISRAKSLSTATAASHSGCLVEVRGTMLLTEENETVTHFLLAHSTQDQICSRRATGMKYTSVGSLVQPMLTTLELWTESWIYLGFENSLVPQTDKDLGQGIEEWK